MKQQVRQLWNDLGPIGVASVLALCACALFFSAAVKPLKERAQRLERELERRSPERGAMNTIDPQSGLADFYRYLDRPEKVEDWLAKLHGVGVASGLDLRTGEYRLVDSGAHFKRYEIALPVNGTYGQIRSFIETALYELPVASVDRASLRRKSINDSRVEGELVVTLHLRRQ